MGNEPSSPREETFIHFPLEKCTQVLYTAEFVSYFKIKVFTARRRSLREGNVFNHVCLSVHRGGSPCDYFPWCHMGTPTLPHEPMGPLPHPLPHSWACSNFFTWDSPTTWTCLNLLTWGGRVSPAIWKCSNLFTWRPPASWTCSNLFIWDPLHICSPYINLKAGSWLSTERPSCSIVSVISRVQVALITLLLNRTLTSV